MAGVYTRLPHPERTVMMMSTLPNDEEREEIRGRLLRALVH